MKAWEYVVNTAMLGTDKPIAGKADLPEDIAEIAQLIDAVESSDKEAKFLQKAAVIYNYRQCGFTPVQVHDLPATIAAAEIKPYCSAAASAILGDILNEDNAALLQLWLTLCSQNDQLFLPDVLPVVLDKAEKEESLHVAAIACGGMRGEWLSRLNPAWGYFNVLPDEEIWRTGKPEERIKVIKQLRKTDPDKAREWLQQTWDQENAASKVELLKTMRIGISSADLPWLESLLHEKGQKIKDGVMALLKHLPQSSIVNKYRDLLIQSVSLKKEKAMLGMMTKVSIVQKLPLTIDEEIFKSGIEKMAGPKSSISDEGFIIYQLIAAVPPSLWETQFDARPQQVVEYFEKYALSQMGALVQAVSTFNADDWIPHLLDQASLYTEFINKLPVAQRDRYLYRFFENDKPGNISIALQCEQEWSMDFTKGVFSYIANHPYQYTRAFFNKNIRLIPTGMLNQLEKIEANDTNQQSAWQKNRDHLTKLLGLKQQTLKAFNA